MWSNTTEKKNINMLQRQQNKILKIIFNLDKLTPKEEVYQKTKELNIRTLIKYQNILFLHQKYQN